MEVNNTIQLQQALMSKIGKALELTMKELLNQLQEYIKEEVYSYSPTFNVRTMETLNNWEYSNMSIVANEVFSELSFSGLSCDIENFSHGSCLSGELDPEYFLNIIENGNKKTAFGFPLMSSRPFWSKFVDYVNKNLDSIFYKYCRVQGVTLTHEIG